MNPVLLATVRRHWPLAGAIAIFLVFSVADQVWLEPLLRRYQHSIERAAEIGMTVDPETSPPTVPPRLFALIADNAMPEAEAQAQGGSGALTADLIGDLNTRMRAHGIHVIVAEPGTVNQQPLAAQVSARLRLRCRYPQFVALLDDIARGSRLLAVDRFTIVPQGEGMTVEIWITRYILKQGPSR